MTLKTMIKVIFILFNHLYAMFIEMQYECFSF